MCFSTTERQRTCTLLARWEPAYKDPWRIVTDRPPAQADVAWYGLRAWLGASSTDRTHDGWRWEQPTMTDPRRAARGWLVMALAMRWVVSTVRAAEAALPTPACDALPETHSARAPLPDDPHRVACAASTAGASA